MKHLFLLILMLSFGSIQAQMVQNSIKIHLNNKDRHIAISTGEASVDIEGYEGDDIIIEPATTKIEKEIPEQAEGLSHIPLITIAEDNTINYRVIADTTILFQIQIEGGCKHLKIRVPNNLQLFNINSGSYLSDSKITVKDLKGSFRVGGTASLINVSNVTGPFEIVGFWGKISLSDILWKQDAISRYNPFPYFIKSLNSDIDISLPEDLKANLRLEADNGEVFSDLNLKPGLLMNGGGVKISIQSNNGNIYLRKQK